MPSVAFAMPVPTAVAVAVAAAEAAAAWAAVVAEAAAALALVKMPPSIKAAPIASPTTGANIIAARGANAIAASFCCCQNVLPCDSLYVTCLLQSWIGATAPLFGSTRR